MQLPALSTSALFHLLDDKQIISAPSVGVVKMWTIEENKTDKCNIPNRFTALAVRRRREKPQYLVTGSNNGDVLLWDGTCGNVINSYEGHAGWIWCIEFCSDGVKFASSCQDRSVRVWTIEDMEAICCLEMTGGICRSVSFTGEGKLLYTSCYGGHVECWDATLGAKRSLPVLSESSSESSIYSVTTNPVDCDQLVCGRMDGVIAVHDCGVDNNCCHGIPDLKRPQSTLSAHKGCITSIIFSSDASMLVSASNDQIVRVWD